MQSAPNSRKDWLLFGAILLAAPMVVAGVASLKQRHQSGEVAIALTGGDPARAPLIFTRYGCTGCHTIAGVPGADGKVGPPLTGVGQRVYIGGTLNNTPDNLVQWIVAPQRFSPNSAMPVTGISEAEARDLAAYLYGQ